MESVDIDYLRGKSCAQENSQWRLLVFVRNVVSVSAASIFGSSRREVAKSS